jgi:hypothetical protein
MSFTPITLHTLQHNLRVVLRPRLNAFPALYLQLIQVLRVILHSDVAGHLALLLFGLPVANETLDAWIAQIQATWRTHFNTRECYDGVVFLPQSEIRLKRPVLALFQHRHVVNTSWCDWGEMRPHQAPPTFHPFVDHTIVVRFYGHKRDVERMKQRTRNVLGSSMQPFRVTGWQDSCLLIQTRLPSALCDVIRQYSRNDTCIDCAHTGHRCPLTPYHCIPPSDYWFDNWHGNLEQYRISEPLTKFIADTTTIPIGDNKST